MSGAEVGTAYVRVRPQMSSFKAETQTGIRSAFSTVGKILLPTIAFAGVTQGIRKSVEAAELKQVVTGQLQQAFRQVGLSFSQNGPPVEAAIRQQQRLGFTFDESAQAMTRSVRATADVGTALKLQAAAADLARGQNIGLLQATQILVRAYNGQTVGLKRIGVEVAKGSKGIEVLDAVQKKFAGSADTFSKSAAGAQQRFTASLQETEATIGGALLPTVTRLNTRLADWLDNTENQKKIQDAANEAVKVGGVVVHDLGVAFNLVEPPLKTIIDLLGGLGHVVQTALVVGLLAKTRRAVLGMAGLKSSVGPVSQALAAFTKTAGGVDAVGRAAKGTAAALDGAGAAGQRATGLIEKGVAADLTEMTALNRAAGKTGAALLSASRARSGPIGGSAATPVGRSNAAFTVAAGSNLAEASGLNTLSKALDDVAESSQSLVEDATIGSAEIAKNSLSNIEKVTKSSSNAVSKGAADEARAFQATGVEGAQAGAEIKAGQSAAADSLRLTAQAATAAGGQLTTLGRAGAGAAETLSTSMGAAATTVNTLARETDGATAATERLTLAQRAGALAGAGFAKIPGGTGLVQRVTAAGGLGKILAGTVGKAFSAALTVYIGDAVVKSLTGFSPLGALKNEVTQPGATERFRTSVSEASSSKAAVPSLRVAKDQADIAVQTAKVALSQVHAAKTTLAYRTALDTLHAAQVTQKDTEDALTKGVRKSSSAAREQIQALIHLASQDTQTKNVGEKYGLVIRNNAESATLLAGHLRQLARAEKDLSPLQRHNIDLLADFIDTLKTQPPPKITSIILNNKDALASLDEIVARVAVLSIQVGLFGGKIQQSLTSAFEQAAGAARARAGTTTTVGGASLPRVFEFGKLKKLDLARLKAETGKDQTAIKAAAQAELDQVDKTVKYLEGLKSLSPKARKARGDNLANFYGQQAQLQSEIDSVTQTAVSAAAAAATKAQTKYQGQIADRDSALKRAASKARAALLHAATLGLPTAGLAAKLRAADNAQIEFFKTEAKNSRLGADQMRTYRADVDAAEKQKTADFTALAATVQKERDAGLQLQLDLANLKLKQGRGSQAQVDKLQDEIDAREKKTLRDQVTRFSKRAADASLGKVAQDAAAKKANDAEDKLLTLGATEATRRGDRLQLAVDAAANAVTAAGSDSSKLNAAQARERKALQLLVAFDKAKAKDFSISADERAKYQAKTLADQKRLLDLAGNAASGYTLAQLFAEASSEFATYGSNIGKIGTPLSPQDERANLAKVLGRIANKKHPPVVVQHFYAGSASAQQAFVAAKAGAKHLYIGA